MSLYIRRPLLTDHELGTTFYFQSIHHKIKKKKFYCTWIYLCHCCYCIWTVKWSRYKYMSVTVDFYWYFRIKVLSSYEYSTLQSLHIWLWPFLVPYVWGRVLKGHSFAPPSSRGHSKWPPMLPGQWSALVWQLWWNYLLVSAPVHVSAAAV